MIGWRDGDGGLHRDTLFGVFAALARGDAWSFPALRPHQREPWHAFTVQCAAMALIRAGIDDPPGDEAAWRELLIGLTPDQPDGSAWDLVVDDWSRPALLQPPVVSAASRSEYKNPVHTPDALDMLVTAKNHDLKREKLTRVSQEEWIFALITVQTASAYGGKLIYGSSRMNSNTGSRLIARVRPPGGAGASFNRDVRLLARLAVGERSLKALLWLEPNDGLVSIPYSILAPSLYVDCARRIRLNSDNSGIKALYATAAKARVNADAAAGVTGDPYAPINLANDASITPKRETFGYRGLSKLLEAPLPILARLHENDATKDVKISFSAIVRKGGTKFNTEGLFERIIKISRVDELNGIDPVTVWDNVGHTARRRSDEAGSAAGKLKYALFALFQGAPSESLETKKLKVRLNDSATDSRVSRWIADFEHKVQIVFFDDAFWSEVTGQCVDCNLSWRKRLRDIARDVFNEAGEMAPRTAMSRIRAVARSRGVFEAQMTKWLQEVA